MTKESKNGVVNFHPYRKLYTAPEIDESYMNDNGEMIHILKNGNELSENNYVLHWGIPKGKIVTDKKYKGENPDKRHII